MANDNDFLKEKLDSLRDDAFQPSARRARIRMRIREAQRAGGWKWAAIPVAAMLAVMLLIPAASSVAKAHNAPSPALEHVHHFLMAHWNGLVNLFHHIPIFNSAPEVLPAELYAVEPVRTMQFAARSAPEFRIVEPSGRTTTLAELKGQVVVVQFLYTWCGHCENTAEWLSRLETEFGPRGLRVFGVAFNDEVNTVDAERNRVEVVRFSQHARFPVGLSAKEPVLQFLDLQPDASYGVPQLVVIDREGIIRAQTSPRPGKGELIEEPVMRRVLEDLLAANQ